MKAEGKTMSELKLSVSEMKELMDKMSALGLQKVSVSQGDFTFEAEAKQPAQTVLYADAAPAVPIVPAVTPAAPAEPAKEAELSGNVMKSPIVGTFYTRPAPDKDPFVTVGTRVKKGDVLFIIESMKLMNEVTSEFDGEVAEILAEDGQGVEYGQPVMVIR